MGQEITTTCLADARVIRRAIQDEQDKHLKLCSECRPMGPGRNRYCPEGWELAEKVTAASAEVARHQDILADQMRLF